MKTITIATIIIIILLILLLNIKIRIHKITFFPVVLYGCETWSPTLREEHRLRVFENKMLRRIFGPKRDEVTGDWRKLHNGELHYLYSSVNQSPSATVHEEPWPLLQISPILSCPRPASSSLGHQIISPAISVVTRNR
jgi:hypothetical protein